MAVSAKLLYFAPISSSIYRNSPSLAAKGKEGGTSRDEATNSVSKPLFTYFCLMMLLAATVFCAVALIHNAVVQEVAIDTVVTQVAMRLHSNEIVAMDPFHDSLKSF